MVPMAMANDVPAFCEVAADFDYVANDAFTEPADCRCVFGEHGISLTVLIR